MVSSFLNDNVRQQSRSDDSVENDEEELHLDHANVRFRSENLNCSNERR